MKRVFLLALPALLFGLVVAGCGKDPVSPPAGTSANPESQAILGLIDETPDLADLETYEAPGENEFGEAFEPAGLFSTAEAINPVFFFRVIRERERDIHIESEIVEGFEIAKVRVEDRFAGTFNIVTTDTVDTGVVIGRVKKPLRDRGLFRALLRRPTGADFSPERHRHRGWELVAVSNREIASPEHSAKIVSVRLETRSGLDVTITDPLALMRFPEELPKVPAGEPVKVTVQVEDPSDHVFLLCGWGRLRMRPVATGVFASSFRAPYNLRLFRLGVNALDRGTLFDDAAPYDSDFWGLVARTAPPTMAQN